MSKIDIVNDQKEPKRKDWTLHLDTGYRTIHPEIDIVS